MPYFDPKEQLWVGAVDVGMVDGQRRRVRRKAKTKAGLAAKLREVERAREDGLPVVNQTATTAAWLDFWLTKILPGTVRRARRACTAKWSRTGSTRTSAGCRWRSCALSM